ncbi:MAG TPA: ATP-binding cassette domain-containing protein [Candidatus Dormibacteraeota bacterium]
MVRFENVSRAYGSLTALKGVSFELEAGELAFLVGPSGAGKSTLMRLINREVAPSDGEVWVDGLAVHSLKPSRLTELRRRVGVVFQDYKLLRRRTALENLAFALQVADLRLPRAEVRRQAQRHLEAVGLGGREGSFPHELSGGQQQRLAIARALVTRPKVLLADEPTGNLDEETARPIVHLLEEIARRGTAVLVATHDMDMVRRLRRRVLRLEGGALVDDASPVAVAAT